MPLRQCIGIAMLSAVSTFYVGAAHAQGLTRAQVRQQLIEAQQNGLDYVTDTSYPAVNPIYQYRVQQLRAQHAADTGFGPQTDGSAQSGAAAPVSSSMPAADHSASHDECVGPVSFCNLYFGS